MEKGAVNGLNLILKGKQVAIDAYERFIQDVGDDRVKKEFQEIQRDHKKRASELFIHIQSLGGKPESNIGFAGFMASAKAAMNDMGKTETIDILKKAYDGEDKKIAKAEEIIRGDLDKESEELIKNILSEDQDHLKKMLNLINGIEGRH